VFINATGDAGDPAYPWQWAHNILHAPDDLRGQHADLARVAAHAVDDGLHRRPVLALLLRAAPGRAGKDWSQYVEPDDRGTYPDPNDPRRDDFFIDSGDDNTWQDRRTLTYGLQGSLVQRIHRHELEFGFEHQFQTVQYLTIDDPWVFDPNGLGGSHDLWKTHRGSATCTRATGSNTKASRRTSACAWTTGSSAAKRSARWQDTANHNVSPETRTSFYDDTKSFFGRRYKTHLSPRIIVAHPITENSSFFFNYGQFTQNPSYRYVYSKLTSVSSESFPLLGNPDLNPEVSINYELGAKTQIVPGTAINATFFVKDVYDYPTATTFKRSEGTSLVDVFVYLNGHFARFEGVRGRARAAPQQLLERQGVVHVPADARQEQ
jgi:outer membrane receptor protein involved in Fe transport